MPERTVLPRACLGYPRGAGCSTGGLREHANDDASRYKVAINHYGDLSIHALDTFERVAGALTAPSMTLEVMKIEAIITGIYRWSARMRS